MSDFIISSVFTFGQYSMFAERVMQSQIARKYRCTYFDCAWRLIDNRKHLPTNKFTSNLLFANFDYETKFHARPKFNYSLFCCCSDPVWSIARARRSKLNYLRCMSLLDKFRVYFCVFAK